MVRTKGKAFGSQAVYVRPLALRPHLTMGLPFSVREHICSTRQKSSETLRNFFSFANRIFFASVQERTADVIVFMRNRLLLYIREELLPEALVGWIQLAKTVRVCHNH